MDSHQPIAILLVEDEESSREVISSMLVMMFPQAHILCAVNGQEGFDCFRRHQPEVVITDINMPDMNGVELLDAIFAIKPETGSIVVTAHSDNNNLERIFSTGRHIELVPKPIDFGILISSINRCIAALSKPH